MILTDKQINNFQKIYKKRFGEILSRDDAIKKGVNILTLLKLLL